MFPELHAIFAYLQYSTVSTDHCNQLWTDITLPFLVLLSALLLCVLYHGQCYTAGNKQGMAVQMCVAVWPSSLEEKSLYSPQNSLLMFSA